MGLQLKEIEESVLNRDVEYLNASTGLGANEIIKLSLAHRVAEQLSAYNIDPSVIYAFFKQEMPQSLPSSLLPDTLSEWSIWISSLVETQTIALALLPRPMQEEVLAKAGTTNILPIERYNQLEAILNQLDEVRTHYAQMAPIVGNGVTLNDVLADTSIANDDRSVIVEAFANDPSFSPAFIQRLGTSGTISENAQKELEKEYFLLELGNREVEQASNLKAVFGKEGYSAVVERISDFAKWTEEDWQIYADSQPVMEGVEPTTIDPQVLYQKATRIAPTVALLASLERRNNEALENLSTLREVIDQEQWTNLLQIPLLAVAQNPDLELSEAVLEELKTVQRVQKIAPSAEIGSLLIDEGVTSAQQAFRMGAAGISQSLQAAGLDSTTADGHAAHTFVLAQQQVGDAMGVGVAIQLLGNNQLSTNVLPSLANIEELFGSTDTCACEHCRSVYSPAAYLTDLLQWIKNNGTDVEGSELPLDALLARRPDLEHILLNCKNAHTPLPYIDLVNEVLEYAIGKNMDATSQVVEGYEKRNTTWSAEVLRLQPEYQLDLVYEKLVTLPNSTSYAPTASYSAFNLWQAQFHLYLDRLGIDTYELVKQWGQYGSILEPYDR